MSEWKTVKVCSNRPEAEIIGGLLRQHGFEVNIRSDDIGGLYPPLALSSGVKVQVAAEDLEEAEKLIKRADIKPV